MSKYSPPAVTLRDVLAALPPLPLPLGWRVAFLPLQGQSTTAYVAVELVVTLPTGAQQVWRRWGRRASSTSPTQALSVALVAAQEAHNYVAAGSVKELLGMVVWELGIPIDGGDAPAWP